MHADNKSIKLIGKHKFDEKFVKIEQIKQSNELKYEPRFIIRYDLYGVPKVELTEACRKIAISPPVQHARHAPDFHIDKSKNFKLDKSQGTLMRQK